MRILTRGYQKLFPPEPVYRTNPAGCQHICLSVETSTICAIRRFGLNQCLPILQMDISVFDLQWSKKERNNNKFVPKIVIQLFLPKLYWYRSAKNNIPTSTGKKYFASPGPLAFFWLLYIIERSRGSCEYDCKWMSLSATVHNSA